MKLRDVKIEDAQMIASWKDQEIMRKMSIGMKASVTKENQADDISYALEDIDQVYKIICHQDEPIGYIRINYLDADHRFAWLRFGLGKKRGQGLCKKGLKLFLDDCFASGLHRVDAEVYDYNLASFHLLEKLGFIREGIKRQAHYEEGYADIYVYGLLKGDYQ